MQSRVQLDAGHPLLVFCTDFTQVDQKQSFSDIKAIMFVSQAQVNSLGVFPESHTGFSKGRRRVIWESGHLSLSKGHQGGSK